ncbi:MAG: hypothetical protein ACRDRL_27130 [Sciscionella sp.]
MSERWFNERGTIFDENRLPVARVVGQEEDDHDAKLMAAAPELYDALKLAEISLTAVARHSVQPSMRDDAREQLQTIRAALIAAKDTGTSS